MDTESLKVVANSSDWEILKELLVHYRNEIDMVSNPIRSNGITISPSQAYLGKLLAVQKFDEFINYVDSFKNVQVRSLDKRDLMI